MVSNIPVIINRTNNQRIYFKWNKEDIFQNLSHDNIFEVIIKAESPKGFCDNHGLLSPLTASRLVTTSGFSNP